jgi:hypothetical protein
MCEISDTTGSFGYGETSGEIGDFATPSARKAFFKELIAKANSVPLIKILKFYNVKIDQGHYQTVCPFKSHKGGRENSASFKYYEATNSFFCFGCKVGGPKCHSAEFVAAMDGTNAAKAAYKIINVFGNDVNSTIEYADDLNFSEQLEIMLDFSNSVREFRQKYLDKNSQDFIEQRCLVYDELLAKHNMNNETLLWVVDYMKEQFTIYISCHTL